MKIEKAYKFWNIILVIFLSLFIGYKGKCQNNNFGSNDQFRNQIVKFVRKSSKAYINHKLKELQLPESLKLEGKWTSYVTIYYNGKIRGFGKGQGDILAHALLKSVIIALNDKKYSRLNNKDIENSRFLITLYQRDKQPYSFIEYKGKGKELIAGLIPIRKLNKKLIQKKIIQGKEYLIRIIDKANYGAHEYFYPITNSFKNKVHTVFTSDTVYTLLKIYNWNSDKTLLEISKRSADFILSMQNRQKGTKEYGAFYNSYNLNTNKKEKMFVVGTAAKSISVLLELYKLTKEDKYLNSAKLAADWLITMQHSNGKVMSYRRYRDGKWWHSTQYSLLYNGQVLQALSRIYKITNDEKYYKSAKKIAQNFVTKIENEGYYLGDGYREKNSVSTGWVVRSLIDFYKVTKNKKYKEIALKCSNSLLKRQIKNKQDIFNHGRWNDVGHKTSGNGWMAEVMVSVYELCKVSGQEDCHKYKNSIIRVIRWLIQNTYSKENTYFVRYPNRVIGGLPSDYKFGDLEVRTDSVFHAVNAYLEILDDLKKGTLLSIPEKPLPKRVNYID